MLFTGVEPQHPLARSLSTNHYTTHASSKQDQKLSLYTKQNSDENMLAADWLRLSCRVDGVGWGEEGSGQARSNTHISLSPILTDDILDSIKPALKLEGALLKLRKAQSI